MTTTEQIRAAFHVPLQQFIRKRIADETMAEDALQLDLMHFAVSSTPSYLAKTCQVAGKPHLCV